ncbi:MAG: phosphotransferase enzyme family protein [Janthinobacterium lividum]
MTLDPPAPFVEFARLRRGDSAPDWISRCVTDAWALDPAGTTLHLIAVSENATFRVDVDGSPHMVLRLHRPGYVADPAQIAGELTWMQAIAAQTDVRVPEVVPTRDGSLVHELASPHPADAAPRWFAVAFAFVDGEILEDVLASGEHSRVGALTEVYARVGATTARLHDHVLGWSPPSGFRRFSWKLPDMLGAGSRWGDWRAAALSAAGSQTLERAERAAREVLGGVAIDGAGWGLVHADLRPSNIMVDGGGRLTVIDFDDCGVSWLLWDFAAALSFIEHEGFAPQLAASWVEGYRSVRSFSEQDVVVASALSMVRRLQMLGWTTTHRKDALPPAVWAAQVPGTLEVARRYLDQPQWLFDGL